MDRDGGVSPGRDKAVNEKTVANPAPRSGARGPAVRTFWLTGTGAPPTVVSFFLSSATVVLLSGELVFMGVALRFDALRIVRLKASESRAFFSACQPGALREQADALWLGTPRRSR